MESDSPKLSHLCKDRPKAARKSRCIQKPVIGQLPLIETVQSDIALEGFFDAGKGVDSCDITTETPSSRISHLNKTSTRWSVLIARFIIGILEMLLWNCACRFAVSVWRHEGFRTPCSLHDVMLGACCHGGHTTSMLTADDCWWVVVYQLWVGILQFICTTISVLRADYLTLFTILCCGILLWAQVWTVIHTSWAWC